MSEEPRNREDFEQKELHWPGQNCYESSANSSGNLQDLSMDTEDAVTSGVWW